MRVSCPDCNGTGRKWPWAQVECPNHLDCNSDWLDCECWNGYVPCSPDTMVARGLEWLIDNGAELEIEKNQHGDVMLVVFQSERTEHPSDTLHEAVAASLVATLGEAEGAPETR